MPSPKLRASRAPSPSMPMSPHSTKRHKSAEETTVPLSATTDTAAASITQTMPGPSPDNVVAVFEGGDVVLQTTGLSGLRQPVGLRCSSHILTMTSPVFKTLLTSASGNEVCLLLPDDDGDALLLLCNILHLRNNALPSRLPISLLYRIALLAKKYRCATAAGRATLGWFDHLLHLPPPDTNNDICKIIQAAYFLEEPTSFVRFTERWVLSGGMGTKMSIVDPTLEPGLTSKLAMELQERREFLIACVRADLDLIIDPCSLAFSEACEHYIDYMPGMTPDPDEETGRPLGSLCYVDSQCSTLYLGALRDERVWPPTVWPKTLHEVMENLKNFEIPTYDDCDKCEFCEDVKAKFKVALGFVRNIHAERLWGLCLDCFKADGVFAGECRYEHPKPAQPKK